MDKPLAEQPDRPKAELELGSERVGKRQLTRYEPGVALRICEYVAGGMTLTEICQMEGMPSKATFYRWVIRQPELAKALAASRELSAYNFEEEALGLAREIKSYPETGTKVRAYEVAMGQLRWSAARRNPREYGERGNMNIVVPVNINTTLDMGSGPQVGSAAMPDVYSLEATLPQEEREVIDAEFEEVPAVPKDLPDELPAAEPILRRRTVVKHRRKKRGKKAS